MLFKRSQPRNFSSYLRDMIWPAMSWQRIVSYFHHRLFRHTDSTYRITGGMASGAAVSFTPFLGLHMLLSFLLAHIFRQSKIAALVGSFWGNPWTFPAIFYGDYKLGVWIMDIFGDQGFSELPQEQTFANFLNDPFGLFLPLLIGGMICALVSWPLTYLILCYPVKRMQLAYRQQRQAKIEQKKAALL